MVRQKLRLYVLGKSSGNKPLSILWSISIPCVVTNQVDFLLMGPNNANTSRNSQENAVNVNFAIENKGMRKWNRDAKVGFKV